MSNRWLTWVLASLLFLVVGGICLQVSSLWHTAAFGITTAIYLLPGLSLSRWIAGGSSLRCASGWVIAGVLGPMVSAFFLYLVVAWVGWNLPIVILTLALLTAVPWFLPVSPLGGSGVWKAWSRQELNTWLLVSVGLSVGMAFPMLRVGAEHPRGYAYAGLFGLDFLVRNQFEVSLALGPVPPTNMFLAGYPLRNYYYLWYMLPATAKKFMLGTDLTHGMTLVVSLLGAILFIALLVMVVRVFLPEGPTAVFTVCMAIFASSYYYLYLLVKKSVASLPVFIKDHLPVDYLFEARGMSHVWTRDFLLEPQAVACVGLAGISLVILTASLGRANVFSIHLLLGGIFAIMVGVDTMIAIMTVVWYGLTMIVFSFREDSGLAGRHGFLCTLGATVVFLGLASMYFITGTFTITERAGSIILQPNTKLLILSPAFLFVELGPLLLLAVAYVWTHRGIRRDMGYTSIVLMILVALVFMFFVDETVEGNVVVRKGIKLLLLPLMLLAGAWFAQSSSKRAITAIAMVFFGALPTFATDLHFLADIDDASHTTYLSREDRRACDWMRAHIAPTAVVQGVPEHKGYFGYSPIVIWGERAMAAGLWSMAWKTSLGFPDAISKRIWFQKRYKKVESIFRRDSRQKALQTARSMSIDYLYIGPEERRRFGVNAEKFETAAGMVRKVYDEDGVKIFDIRQILTAIGTRVERAEEERSI